jgi:hypothetical protein
VERELKFEGSEKSLCLPHSVYHTQCFKGLFQNLHLGVAYDTGDVLYLLSQVTLSVFRK